jgi:hypothetical protein
MSNRTFLAIVFAVMAVAFIALTIEQYGRCRASGKTDCPELTPYGRGSVPAQYLRH